MMANISRDQLRLAPAVRHTLYARAPHHIAITFTLWLLALTTVLVAFEKSKWRFGNAYVIGIFLCLGGLSLLNSVRLWRGYITTPVYSNYTRLVFTALLLWCAVTIVRADWFNKWELQQILGNYYFGWAWVVPVSMVFGSNIGMWRQALMVVAWLGALGCIILIVGWVLVSLHGDFGFTRACPIALLFWHYFPKRTKRIVLLAALISLFLSVLAATRNEVFGTGIMILFASYIQFFRRQVWRLRTRACLIFVFSMLFVMIAYAASVDRVPFAGDTINAGIGRFKDKLYKNSRTNYEGDLVYTEFLQEVRDRDFVIGRGCRGTYAAEGGTLDSSMQVRQRSYIECGYFQVILHGGVVMLILMLSLAIPAIYLGMFRSRNWFTRACAFIILGRLLEMVPFGLPIANVQYVLFWMAIGSCLTWKIRAMSDADIVKILASRCAIGVREKR
jgi:hypothetical protein